MKKRLFSLLVLLFFSLAVFAADSADSTLKPRDGFKITELARHKFIKTRDFQKVKTFAEFSALLTGPYAKDLKKGLDQLGQSDLYDTVIATLSAPVPFTEGDIPYETAFKWMFYRKNGQVRTMSNPQWLGKDRKGQPQSINAYIFEVCQNGTRYTFVVPKACLNLSLLKDEAYQSTCSMAITKEEECAKVGEKITVDCSASQGLSDMKLSITPEGANIEALGNNRWSVVFSKPGEYSVNAEGKGCDNQVVTCSSQNLTVVHPVTCQLAITPSCNVVRKPVTINAETGAGSLDHLTIKNEAGEVVFNQEKPQTPLSFTAKKPGLYTVEAQASGECKQVRTAQSELRFMKPIFSPFYLLGEAGIMLAKGTYSGYFYPRLGAGVWLADQALSLEVIPGAGISLTGLPFHHFFMIDARLAAHPGPAYLAAGIGLSSKVRDAEPGLPTGEWKSDFDLSFAAGLYLNPDRNMAIIGEFRLPVAEGVPVKYNHAFSLGFRYALPLSSNKNPCDQSQN